MAPIFAAQIAYLFYAMFAFTGVGIPISMPPGVEDPFLSKIAPDECLYYTNWAGATAPDPASQNQVEQLYSEPEVDDFLSYVSTRFRGTVLGLAQQNGDPTTALFTDAGLVAAELLLTQPTSIFVVSLSTEPIDMEAAVVVQLGDKKQKTEDVLDKIHGSILQQFAQNVQIQGKPFKRVKVDQVPMITWGIEGDYLMVGIGEGAIDGILDRSTSPPPAWLSELQAKHSLPRRATFTYADLRKILAIGVDAIEDPVMIDAYKAIGLQHLESYVCVTGLDEERFVSRTEVSLKGQPTGLLSALPSQPLKKADLGAIPANSLAAFAMKVNLHESLDVLIAFLNDVEPRNAEAFEAALTGIRQNLDVDIRKQVFDSLGDVVCVYASPDEGGLLTGWTIAIPAIDAEELKKAQTRIDQRLAQQPGMSIVVNDVGGQSVTSFSLPGIPFAPTWCVTGSELVFGLYPQAVRGHLRPKTDESSIADRPGIEQLFGADGGPCMIAYQDSKAIVRAFYPFLQMGFQTYAGLLQNEGIDVDVSILPSAGAVTRHMQPGVWAVQRTETGYRFESHQSMPGGNLGATAPMIAAATLPAGNAARLAARRNQSINNLRQLALAAINHESTFGHYPAAYNTDENGKPLLSWRVHILPFLGEDQLYNEFRLSEPWNSPNNRKLIARMPLLYRSPNSHSDPGKTNYVALRGVDGVIVPPAEDQNGKERPKGTKIRTIRDGTSKTVLVVEAGDEKAVIWTKPDDFTPDKNNPINGLIGLHRDLFLAAFCDGHTRVIASSTNPQTLKAIFTRDGGETVNDF